MVLIVSQIIGVAAVALYLWSFQLKKRRQIVWVTCLSYALYVLQYLLLGAFAGAIMDILSAASSFFAGKKSSPRLKRHAKWIALVIFSLIIAAGLSLAVVQRDWVELLPIAGALLQAGGLWFNKEQTIRKCGLLGAPFWLVYNYLSQAYGAALGSLLTIVSTLIALARYRKKERECMIITNVEGVRDPFILAENGVYYLYGTGVLADGDWDNTIWACYVNDSGDLHGAWKPTEQLVYKIPAHAEKQFWAPEVHKYNGKYYMLASYFSSETQHRGSSILEAPTPTGPFAEISNGHITPHDRDCIDATFYVDNAGQPWLIFVHEWTCTDDGVGRMDVAKLSPDLTRLISKPVELFRADSPLWTNESVTDGCFIHKKKDGTPLMLWSNFEKDGYCVGVTHSQNGAIDGAWEHETAPLYKRGTLDRHDGGHGMTFIAADGKTYLCCHSPNTPCEACKERTVLIPVTEREGTLRLG